MQGVLELAQSIDLTSALLAADLDVKTPQHSGPAAAATANVNSALALDDVSV